MLYNMYIYNRRGKCLFYHEWYRPYNTFHDDPLEERKLVFGMIFSLKDLATKLSPTNSIDGLHTLKTNTFTLHHFQTLSGLMFVINSSPDVQDLHTTLGQIYSQIYVDYIARNPLYRREPDEPIESPLFTSRVEEFLRSQNLLKS